MENNIKVNRYIIHYLEKEQSKPVSEFTLSKSISLEDEFSIILVNGIHKSISENSSLKNTKYKIGSNLFSTNLEEYFECSDDDSFLIFSSCLEELRVKIDKIAFATGGYYVFVDYMINSKRYISVVLLRKKDGINVERVGDNYKLKTTENLNIDKIAMAFRLNYEIYLRKSGSDDDTNYIAFITTQQNKDISNYFTEWVNTGDLIKSSKNTGNLIKIIKTIECPTDDEGNTMTREDFKKAIYAFTKKDSIVNLSDISSHFYGKENPNKISDFAKDNEIIIDNEFKKYKTIWNKLIQVKAKIDGIELNVDTDKLNPANVEVHADMIIIRNRKLIEALKLDIKRNDIEINSDFEDTED
jgi:nucleoid-associated protein